MSNDRKESLASAPTLLRALALIPDEQEEFHSHPHHIMLPLDADAKNILGGCLPPFLVLLRVALLAVVLNEQLSFQMGSQSGLYGASILLYEVGPSRDLKDNILWRLSIIPL